MPKPSITRIAPAALLVAVLPLTGGGAAHADDDDVRRSGSCSAASDWKLKVSPDDGRIEVEAEVDSNVTGQTWRWVLRHEGDVADRGRSRTVAPSGSFEIERRTGDATGTDSFRFRAVHRASGEVCLGRIRL